MKASVRNCSAVLTTETRTDGYDETRQSVGSNAVDYEVCLRREVFESWPNGGRRNERNFLSCFAN
jgi:hypothetical protein